jgi:hypothetical protein
MKGCVHQDIYSSIGDYCQENGKKRYGLTGLSKSSGLVLQLIAAGRTVLVSCCSTRWQTPQQEEAMKWEQSHSAK